MILLPQIFYSHVYTIDIDNPKAQKNYNHQNNNLKDQM